MALSLNLNPMKQFGSMKLFDIVFLSYSEPKAEENFLSLKNRFPRTKRLHGVKGLGRAIKLTAEIVDTEHYFLVDGDNEVVEDFTFDQHFENLTENTHIVWSSKNPVNDLSYGYGGIKLLTRSGVRNFSEKTVDITVGGEKEILFKDEVASITRFNTSPFDSWKAGFREGCMLSLPDCGVPDAESVLNAWKTIGNDRPFGAWAILGAIAGEKFAKMGSPLEINNPGWLELEFKQRYTE